MGAQPTDCHRLQGPSFPSQLLLQIHFLQKGFEEGEGPRAGRAHAGGNRTVWKEGSAGPERDAGRQGIFFGDEPAMLDLVVYSHVAQLVMIEKDYPCTLRDYLEADCKNLVGLVNRMKDRCWGDHWANATGEEMDLNPHIPKPEPAPEPEPVEEKKEEEVKKEETTEKEEKKEEEKEKADEKKEENEKEDEKETEKVEEK